MMTNKLTSPQEFLDGVKKINLVGSDLKDNRETFAQKYNYVPAEDVDYERKVDSAMAGIYFISSIAFMLFSILFYATNEPMVGTVMLIPVMVFMVPIMFFIKDEIATQFIIHRNMKEFKRTAASFLAEWLKQNYGIHPSDKAITPRVFGKFMISNHKAPTIFFNTIYNASIQLSVTKTGVEIYDLTNGYVVDRIAPIHSTSKTVIDKIKRTTTTTTQQIKPVVLPYWDKIVDNLTQIKTLNLEAEQEHRYIRVEEALIELKTTTDELQKIDELKPQIKRITNLLKTLLQETENIKKDYSKSLNQKIGMQQEWLTDALQPSAFLVGKK